VPANIDYFAQLGFNLVRVPFRWERLQPTLGSPLAAADLRLLSSAVEYASAKGLHVVLDTHNYARRRVVKDDWAVEHLIGSELVPAAAFTDYCARLAGAFKGAPSVIFGLMNEPWGLAAEDWLVIADQAIAAVRRAGAEQLILVPGIAYTGAHSWITSGNAVMGNVVDPRNNFAFEVHQYFDPDSSGTSTKAVGARIGSERIEAFQIWARQNGFKAFLGEFAGGEDEVSLEALADICRTLQANSDVWIGWAAWAGGRWWPADYIFNLEPSKSGQIRPQTKILASYAR
jgi:endoglucanase